MRGRGRGGKSKSVDDDPARWCRRGGAQAIEAKAASLGTFPLVSDVGRYQFGSSRSSIFMALQLLLYTGVKRVYVVGCDSSLFSGYATKSGQGGSSRSLCSVRSRSFAFRCAIGFIRGV